VRGSSRSRLRAWQQSVCRIPPDLSTNKSAFTASPFAEKNNARTPSRKNAKAIDFLASSRLRVFALKTGRFLGTCQEYILDNKAPDTCFGQCLQGFRVLKKVVTMTCTVSAFCAKIAK
jgi:hypothetical protein